MSIFYIQTIALKQFDVVKVKYVYVESVSAALLFLDGIISSSHPGVHGFVLINWMSPIGGQHHGWYEFCVVQQLSMFSRRQRVL